MVSTLTHSLTSLNMLNQDDIASLREKGTSNADILKMIGRVVPSASKAYTDMQSDMKTSEVMKDQMIGRMLDENTPKNAPSGLPYLHSVSISSAQKSHDVLEDSYKKIEKIGANASHDPTRYQADEVKLSNLPQTFGKVSYNMGADAWDFVKALVTDPGEVAKNIINPIVGTAQAGIDAAVPGQIFGDTEAKQSAYDLAASYGLPEVVGGMGKLLQGRGYEGLKQIEGGIEQAYTTTYEHPLNTYLLGKGARSLVAGGLKGAGAAGEATVRGASNAAGVTAIDLGSPAARMGKAASNLKSAGQAVGEFGSEQAAGMVRSAIPEALRNPIESMGGKAMDATMAIPGKVARGTMTIGKNASAKLSGINAETLRTAVELPDQLDMAQKGEITIGTVATQVKEGIEGRLSQISETGKLYDDIRSSGQKVTIEKGSINNVLNKWGLQYKQGRLIVDPNVAKANLSGGDIAAIETFLKDYRQEGRVGVNKVLNARQALDELSRWDSNKSGSAEAIAKDFRSVYDGAAKTVTELAELDKKFSGEVSFLKKVKNEYLESTIDPDTGRRIYTLKDSALRRMYGSTRELNDPQLLRLEKIVPGIGNELRVIRAIKDIEVSGGAKVGSYANQILGVSSVVTGNIPGIVTSVIMSPPILIPLLKWYGKIKGNGAQMDGILTKIRSGAKLTPEEKASVGDAMNQYEVQVGSVKYKEPAQPKTGGGAAVPTQEAQNLPVE